jgi:hypothetical protein
VTDPRSCGTAHRDRAACEGTQDRDRGLPGRRPLQRGSDNRRLQEARVRNGHSPPAGPAHPGPAGLECVAVASGGAPDGTRLLSSLQPARCPRPGPDGVQPTKRELFARLWRFGGHWEALQLAQAGRRASARLHSVRLQRRITVVRQQVSSSLNPAWPHDVYLNKSGSPGPQRHR